MFRKYASKVDGLQIHGFIPVACYYNHVYFEAVGNEASAAPPFDVIIIACFWV